MSAIQPHFALAVPAIGAVLIVLTGRWPNLRETVTLVTAVILFAVVASLLPAVMDGERPAVTLFTMLPGLSIALKVEPLGMLFGLLASGLWIINSIYSIGYMRGNNEKNQTRFYVYFAIALASAMGIAFAGNLFTLFIFYELLTLSTYPLVTHTGDDAAREGGRMYLGYLLGSSVTLLLLALVWIWSLTGTLDFRSGGILEGVVSPGIASILLVLFVFGIGKAAVIPIHLWLPAAMACNRRSSNSCRTRSPVTSRRSSASTPGRFSSSTSPTMSASIPSSAVSSFARCVYSGWQLHPRAPLIRCRITSRVAASAASIWNWSSPRRR